MKQRARSAEDKQHRVEALLNAAESVAMSLGGVRFVSLGSVTERAGLHRTGARRYYANKEELFLELAARGWDRWRAGVQKHCDGRSKLTSSEVVRIVCTTISELPVFCDLLTHVPLSLEGSVDIDSARRYKSRAYAAHDEISVTLSQASVMSIAQVQSLLAATIILAAGFWQLAHPTPTLAKLYEEVPQWGHAALDFEDNLTHLLTATALGLMQACEGGGMPGHPPPGQ